MTEAVVAKSLDFRFERDFNGLEVIAKAGDPIARDGDEVIRAPYDDTVLVMPSMAHLKVGTTMVRLGRFEAIRRRAARIDLIMRGTDSAAVDPAPVRVGAGMLLAWIAFWLLMISVACRKSCATAVASCGARSWPS